MTPPALLVSGVRFHRTSDPELAASGLVGWITLTLNGRLRLDSIGLRRTRAGTLRLSFPRRRDSAGREHDLVRPLDRQARAEIEGQILEALERQGVLA